jgi:hypothetical protein
MKGGRDGGIEGKYRTDLPGDLSLANSGVRRNKSRVRQQAWNEPTTSQSRKKSHMKITEVCDGSQVKKILQNELEKVTLKHGLNMYELKDLKKDLKNKSVVAGTDYRAACSNVRKHVASSTKVVLRKRKANAATKIQRQVRSNQGNKGRKSSMRASKEARHRGSKKRGPGKSCAPDRLIGGLDSVLNDLKMKLDTSERRLVESAMRNAGKGAGGCNTVAVKKLFDGPPNIKNKAMTAYNKLGDNEGIKKWKLLKEAAEQRIKIADDKCLKMPEQSLEKHGYCKNSNNPQVKSRLDKLKANLQVKIKEDQAKIAKQAEEKAERDRQRQMKTNNNINIKIKKCVSDAQTLDTEAAKLLPIKPEHKVEDIEPLLADVSARYDKLKQECDEFKKKSRPYNKKRLMIQSSIATMQGALKTKRKELAEKKAAAEKAKQEEALAAKNLEDAKIAKAQAEKKALEKKAEQERLAKEAAEKKRLADEAEKKRLAQVAKEKAEQERLKKEALEKERLAKEAVEKKKKALAEAEAEAARLKAVEAEKKRKEAEKKALIEKQKKEAARLAAEKAKKLAAEQALKAEKLRLEKIAAEKKAADEKKEKEEARIKAELAEKKAKEEAIKLEIEADKKAALFAAKLLAEKKKTEEARQKEEATKKALADKAAKEAQEKMEREAAEKEKKLKAEQDKIKKEQEKGRKAMADEAAKAAREREAQKKKEEDKKAKDAADAEIKKQHKQALVAAKMQTVVLQSQLEKLKKEKEEGNEKLTEIQGQLKKLDEEVKKSNDAGLKERADMIKKSLKNYTELLKA